jgi:GntR family transcriptional regulator, arabinose operon transcriptional repressor
LGCGARRILFFGRPNSAPTVSARAAGYLEAVRSFPGPRLEECVHYGDPSDISAVHDLVARYKPDAVVCANDFTAGQFMTSLNTLNIRVPHDIRVTGMDDIRYATVMQTPLTTIHQPCLDLGAVALAAMLERASNPDMPARDILVDFRLVVRQSTVPAPSGLR